MNPFIFNKALKEALDKKYQKTLSILPFLSIFVTLFFYTIFRKRIEVFLGIAHWFPEKFKPEDSLLFFGFICYMGSILIFGYTVGWLANVLIFRFKFHFSPQKIYSIYFYSDVPFDWIKFESEIKKSQFFEKWDKQLQLGFPRFFIREGILIFSLPMFVLMVSVIYFIKGDLFAMDDLLLISIYVTIFGLTRTFSMWLGSKANYDQVKAISSLPIKTSLSPL